MVEARAGAFIKFPSTLTTPKTSVPQFSALSAFTRASRLTVWTLNRSRPPRCASLHAAPHRCKLGQFLTEPFAQEVMPYMKDLWSEWEDRWYPKPMAETAQTRQAAQAL